MKHDDAIADQKKNGGEFKVKFCNPHSDKFVDHIRNAHTTGYPLIKANELQSKDGVAIVIGSGPSLKDPAVMAQIRELKKNGATIFACKAAIKYVNDRGAKPDYGVSIDPGHHIACPEKITKVKGVTHILATVSNPALFDYMKETNEDVMLFHSACGCPDELNLYKELWGKKQDVLGGGFNVVNRAVTIAQYMGFETIYLAGADGGWRDDQNFYCDEKCPISGKKVNMTDHGLVDGKIWHTAPDMLASSVAIARIAKKNPDRFFFIGDMLPASLSRHGDAFLKQCANMS